MNTLESASVFLALIERGLPVLNRVAALLRRLPLGQAPAFSYENLLLDLTLDLKDEAGRRAYVRRKQRVLFHTHEAGVLRTLAWGEGSAFRSLEANGATWMGTRNEGSREVLLLALTRPGRRGQLATLESVESVKDAFRGSNEYFETLVERPTRRLRLRVLFPKKRPPRDVYFDGGGRDSKDYVPIRIGPDGRARVTWSMTQPALNIVYGLRWAW